MKLDQDSENFEDLRKLMSLKRYEQPPPGYLRHLPGRIVSRLERGEGRLSFWEKVSSSFVLRPGAAYAFALTVCGAVALSAVYTGRRENAPPALHVVPSLTLTTGMAENAAPAPLYEDPPFHVANWIGNTNPANSSSGVPALFAPTLRTVPASFERGN